MYKFRRKGEPAPEPVEEKFAEAITIEDFLDENPWAHGYQYEPVGLRVLEPDDNPMGWAWVYYPRNAPPHIRPKDGRWCGHWHAWRHALRWPEHKWTHDVPSNIRSAEHAKPSSSLSPVEVIRPDINTREAT